MPAEETSPHPLPPSQPLQSESMLFGSQTSGPTLASLLYESLGSATSAGDLNRMQERQKRRHRPQQQQQPLQQQQQQQAQQNDQHMQQQQQQRLVAELQPITTCLQATATHPLPLEILQNGSSRGAGSLGISSQQAASLQRVRMHSNPLASDFTNLQEWFHEVDES